MSIDSKSNYLIENDFVRLSKKYVWTCNKRRNVAYYVQLIKYLKETFFLHKTFWQHGLYFLCYWVIFCCEICKFSWWIRHHKYICKYINTRKIGAMLNLFFLPALLSIGFLLFDLVKLDLPTPVSHSPSWEWAMQPPCVANSKIYCTICQHMDKL